MYMQLAINQMFNFTPPQLCKWRHKGYMGSSNALGGA